MVVFSYPPIPETIYRIQSAERLTPPLYLERQSDGEIMMKPASLAANNTNQQWRVAYQDDGTYRIVNAKTFESLYINAWNKNGQTYFRLWSGAQQQVWTFDPRGSAFIIGDPTSARSLDVKPNDWVVLQSRRNTVSQLWILDTVQPDSDGAKVDKYQADSVKPNKYQPDTVKDDGPATLKRPTSPTTLPRPPPSRPPPVVQKTVTPTPPPRSGPVLENGNYRIVNVFTRHPFYPSLGTTNGDTDLYFMRKESDLRPGSFFYWTVENVSGDRGDLYRITGLLDGHVVSLFDFKDYSQPDSLVVCHGSERICQLIPVSRKTPGPKCFHLVAESGGFLKAVWERVVSTDRDTAAEAAIFDAEDEHQQWRFIPA